MSEWPQLFCVSFYRLKQSEVDSMEDLMLQKIPDLGANEIRDAVNTVAEKVRLGKLDGKSIKVGHLISAVIKNRFIAKHGPEAVMQGPIEEKLARLRTEILKAKDNNARWRIICDGTPADPIDTPEEIQYICPRLEEFATDRFDDFKRPKFKSFAETIGAVASAKTAPVAGDKRPDPEMRKKLREIGGTDDQHHTRSVGHVEATRKTDPAQTPKVGAGTETAGTVEEGRDAPGTPGDAAPAGDGSDLFDAAADQPADEF